MELQPAWWMYSLHAFTPALVLTMAALPAKEVKSSQGTDFDSNSTNSTSRLPSMSEATISILTYVIMSIVYYGIWFVAHGLAFWWLGKPMSLNAYFYKPAMLIYWFPYVFGLVFVLYRAFLASYIFGALAKSIIHRLTVLGFFVSLYMVLITYLKWLTT